MTSSEMWFSVHGRAGKQNRCVSTDRWVDRCDRQVMESDKRSRDGPIYRQKAGDRISEGLTIHTPMPVSSVEEKVKVKQFTPHRQYLLWKNN